MHDDLLAIQPAGVVHEPCGLCPDPVNKEVAQVSDTDRKYSSDEHIALMAAEVTRETASLTEAKDALESQVTDLSGKVDVLEAEKANLETANAALQKDFDDFKTEVERAREIETAKQTRLDAVKAANSGLTDEYFTDGRVQRWAEMTEEAFAAFLEDIAPAAVVVPGKESAAFSGGESPTDGDKPTAGSMFRARRGK